MAMAKKQECNVEVYRRFLKYPPFAPARRGGIHKVVHNLDNGGVVTALAHESVTVEDAEKFYALLLAGQVNNKVEVEKNFEVVTVTADLKDIKELTNAHDYKVLVQALERIATMTIKYEYKKDDFIITHIIHKVVSVNNKVTIMLGYELYKSFINKALTLNLLTYTSLSPISKNLYSFLISNPSTLFHETTLIERATINSRRSDNARRLLIKALTELKDKSIITDFRREKRGGAWTYTIIRPVGGSVPSGRKA